MQGEYDLVDQMMWEDLEDFLTLEEAGLENSRENDTVPGSQLFGYYNEEQ